MRRAITPLFLSTALVVGVSLSAWANPLDLPLNDRKLSAQELAIQRYKKQRLSLKIEGESWHVVQGINQTIEDQQLLELAGFGDRVKDQKRKDFIGSLMAVAGGIVGVFGILAITGVVPVGSDLKLPVGLGSIAGGIVLAGAGEALFPVMLPGDHFLTVEEARTAMTVVNDRLKADLGLPPELGEP